jgi:Uma2 family endonuclease
MRSFSRRPATYADLASLPEHFVGELIDGELIASLRPAPLHSAVSSALGAELASAFHTGRLGPGGWWILDEPELHLGEDVLVPDLAGWRRERLPRLPQEAFFSIAPDWVCEVDLVRKLPKYASAEVAYAWVVTPTQRTLEVFRLEHGRWSLVVAFSGADKVRVEPFEAFELELGRVWGADEDTSTS